MRISEAYGVLSHADKRAKYDMDVLHRHGSAHAHVHARKGSYHSTGPAGGRPASGLSKRRGTFTGPPPSFFRSGAGAFTGQRGRPHTRRAPAAEQAMMQAHAGAGQWGGMGPGQDPFGHKDDVPHFDRGQHERTGQAGAARRARKAREQGLGPADMGVAQGFFVISGILVCVVVLPVVLFGGWWRTDSTKRKKAKSSMA